jgi:protein-S-isoprenylcysteine O-methyltransferase Ste14
LKAALRALLIVAASLAYAGLAVWGWGGIAPFLARPPLIGLTVAFAAIVAASMFAGGNLSAGEREDRGNRWVLVPFLVIGLALGYVPALTDRLGFLTIDGDLVRWIGVVLFAAGGALRLWPVHVLGRRFSGLVAIQPGHALVTTGIYSAIRNPSYLGLLFYTLGWSLAFRSGVGVIMTAMLIPPLVARMEAEEAMLNSQFGAEWAAYKARTARLIPGLY